MGQGRVLTHVFVGSLVEKSKRNEPDHQQEEGIIGSGFECHDHPTFPKSGVQEKESGTISKAIFLHFYSTVSIIYEQRGTP